MYLNMVKKQMAINQTNDPVTYFSPFNLNTESSHSTKAWYTSKGTH